MISQKKVMETLLNLYLKSVWRQFLFAKCKNVTDVLNIVEWIKGDIVYLVMAGLSQILQYFVI